MKTIPPTFISLFLFYVLSPLHAESVQTLDQAVFSQVINDVKIVDPVTLEETPAVEGQAFEAPELIKTGSRSRAQLKAEDGTITRVGSNTIFSFEPNSRTLNLKQGNVLFNSPKGRGGGKIATASASASVLGTTLAVSATPNGGFKVMCMEGQVQVNFPNGGSQVVNAGQMTFVLPAPAAGAGQPGGQPQEGEPGAAGGAEGGTPPAGEPGPVLDFDLEASVQGSALVGGFDEALPSMGMIEGAMQEQQQMILEGGLEETGVAIIDAVSDTEIVTVDADLIEKSIQTTTLANPLLNALAGNIVIGAPSSVPAAHIFTGKVSFSPKDIYGTAFTPDDGIIDVNDPLPYDKVQPFYGIVAKDIAIKGEPYDASHTKVDFSPFRNVPLVVVAAKGVMRFETATPRLKLVGLAEITRLYLISLAASIPSNYTVDVVFPSGSGGVFGFFTAGLIDATNLSVYNSNGSLDIFTEKGLRLFDSTISASTNRGPLARPNFLWLESRGNVELIGTSVSGYNVNIGSDTGNTTIRGFDQANASEKYSTIQAGRTLDIKAKGILDIGKYVSLTSSNDIRLKGETIKIITTSDFPTTIQSPLIYVGDPKVTNVVSLQYVNFQSNRPQDMIADIMIDARTINLTNVQFPTVDVMLRSSMGQANFGSSQSGYVNFISGNKWGSLNLDLANYNTSTRSFTNGAKVVIGTLQ